MKGLKNILLRKFLSIIALVMTLILLVAVFFQIIALQNQTRENAESMFVQVKQLITRSKNELEAIEASYKNSCLLHAETIAYIIVENPDIIGNVEEFRQLARNLEVDEIHIFDETGTIITGSHPEYYGISFDAGEQIGFFKPMLTDKSLRLSQDIAPNTADSVLTQYSALWSSDGKYIVQVGMYPDAILEATEKSELSYIFTLLRGNLGVNLFAVDSVTGEIVGSTTGMDNGKRVDSIGIELAEISKYEKGTHDSVNGVNSFCIVDDMDGTYICYVISNDHMYDYVGIYTLLLLFCLLIISAVLVYVVQNYTERDIIRSISATNERIRAVAKGDIDERVDIQSSQEFSELSDHINYMIGTLLEETEKMSIVLNRTNLRIGVYEYNTQMKNVRYTEHVPEILGTEPSEMEALASDHKRFQAFVNSLKSDPVDGTANTYHISKNGEMYIKLEEITNENTVLGIVMDITEDTESRKRAETERDIDLITGLYNRRGLERRLTQLFAKPQNMRCGALVMIDTDNLKDINDTYGHAVGDIYLKTLADILSAFDAPNSVAGRIGGDEFVLLIYGYENDVVVLDALHRLKGYQANTMITLDDGRQFQLEFSYGYELTRGRSDYELMISTADSYMYNSKRLRKRTAEQLSIDKS